MFFRAAVIFCALSLGVVPLAATADEVDDLTREISSLHQANKHAEAVQKLNALPSLAYLGQQKLEQSMPAMQQVLGSMGVVARVTVLKDQRIGDQLRRVHLLLSGTAMPILLSLNFHHPLDRWELYSYTYSSELGRLPWGELR